MTVSCPSCSSPAQLSDWDASSARLIECTACGHAWVQSPTAGQRESPRTQEQSTYKGVSGKLPPDIRRLAAAAREAQSRFRNRRKHRRMVLASWLGLAMLGLSPIAGAVVFPEQAVGLAPATVEFYRLLGRDVNIYGLEIRNVDVQHFEVDGRKVIAIRGELTNTSSTLRRIPWIRFGIRDQSQAEVYHWVLNTETRPIKPGDTTSFVTRLASPPQTADHLEIRFAHADEIVTNNGS